MIVLSIPEETYHRARAHLLQNALEQVAFLFTEDSQLAGDTILNVLYWHPVPPEGFAVQSEFYVELTDEEKARVIKMAWDHRASLVEIHSHPGTLRVEFSWSDLDGLEEFVPHVRWRLKGKPYLALIVGPRDIDALAWITGDGKALPLDEIRVGTEILKPSCETYRTTIQRERQDGR